MTAEDLQRIEEVARLARLELEPGEAQRMAEPFQRILEAFSALRDLDTQGLEPMTGPCEETDLLRADEEHPGLPADRLLEAAPERVEDFYAVPKTIRGADDDGS